MRVGLSRFQQPQNLAEGIPVDSLFDVLDGITAVEGPHGVSLRSSKQHSASA